jgi:hypothetical protein
MLTRRALTELSRAHEEELVLSVYIARDGSDPGARGAWRLRVDGALAGTRAEVERENADLAAFDLAAASIGAALDGFGRVLPHEGWLGFATADGLFHAEGLPFAPPDIVRWRQVIYTAPYVRALKSTRPVVMALLDGWRARLFEYLQGEMKPAQEMAADRFSVDTSDVHGSKRATTSTGMRGETRTEYAQRILDEDSKRLRKQVVESIVHLIGDNGGGVALCGTPKATAAVKNDLEEKLPGRVVAISEPSFDSSESELAAGAAAAASELTKARQARLLEICSEAPDRGSFGWKRTYHALAAGAVDTLLVARSLIESAPDDAERLVRLALAQGADVEELGDDVGARLWEENEGIAARLRFKLVA